MSTHKENRFIREVEAATRDNPNIDMDLIREWQKIAAMLEKLPPPETEPSVKETAPFTTDTAEFIQSVDINYVVSPVEWESLVSV